MKKKIVSVITCSLLITALFAGCQTNSITTEESKTGDVIEVIGEFDPQVSGQQIVAQEMGFFEEEGINVHLNLLTDPSVATTMIASGEAKISSASNYQSINLVDKGTNCSVIAPIVDASNTQAVVAKPGLDLTSAKDLEGLKMGYAEGSDVIIAVKNMCKDLDVDFDSITLVNLQASEMLASLEKGDIDFFAAWEPWILKANDLGGKTLFTGKTSYLPENAGDVNYLEFYMCINVNNDYIESNPEECKAYVRAMIKATDYINENTEAAAKIVAEKIGIDEEECLYIMKKNVYKVEFNDSYKEACDRLGEYLIEAGLITEVIDYRKYTDTSILDAVLSESK